MFNRKCQKLCVSAYADLTRFATVLKAELSRGFAERHLWMSVIERRPRSRFTRVQRVTCVATLLYTYLAANMVWSVTIVMFSFINTSNMNAID